MDGDNLDGWPDHHLDGQARHVPVRDQNKDPSQVGCGHWKNGTLESRDAPIVPSDLCEVRLRGTRADQTTRQLQLQVFPLHDKRPRDLWQYPHHPNNDARCREACGRDRQQGRDNPELRLSLKEPWRDDTGVHRPRPRRLSLVYCTPDDQPWVAARQHASQHLDPSAKTFRRFFYSLCRPRFIVLTTS